MRKKVIAICTACLLLTGTAAAESGIARQTVPEQAVETVTEAETLREAVTEAETPREGGPETEAETLREAVTEAETKTSQEAGKAEETGDPPVSLIGRALDFFGSAADKAGDAVNSAADAAGKAGKTIGDAAGKAGEAIGGAVDKAGKTIGDAAGSVRETVGGAFEKAKETLGKTADKIRESAGSAMEQAGNAAGEVQETAEELSEGISEAAQEARESYERFALKWGRVLAYLKEKAAHTDITDEEWDRLERGLYRAVDNGYRHGWFGENASIRSIHTGTDFFFETMRYCYQYIKGQLTISEFAKNMLMLTGRDGSGVLVKLLAGIIPGMEIEQAAQVVEKLLPVATAILEAL